ARGMHNQSLLKFRRHLLSLKSLKRKAIGRRSNASELSRNADYLPPKYLFLRIIAPYSSFAGVKLTQTSAQTLDIYFNFL
ncbi:MAG TPA: hypothetical protein VFQ47_10480, partial [Nitrososphaera sp.]|nr:hypothetical protein [Nitrososphaera sp.]